MHESKKVAHNHVLPSKLAAKLDAKKKIEAVDSTEPGTSLFRLYSLEQPSLVYYRYSEIAKKKQSSVDTRFHNPEYYATTIANLNKPKIIRTTFSLAVTDSDHTKALEFDSRFESGNLLSAFRKEDNVYDLILENDINTKGNTQWFFFLVKNTRRGETVTFNIMNFVTTFHLPSVETGTRSFIYLGET